MRFLNDLVLSGSKGINTRAFRTKSRFHDGGLKPFLGPEFQMTLKDSSTSDMFKPFKEKTLLSMAF